MAVTNGHKRSQMVTNGHTWSHMVTNHRIAHWSQMVSRGHKSSNRARMICITNSKGYKRTLERDFGKNEHAVERAEPFPNFWSPPERGSEGKKWKRKFHFFTREHVFPDCSLFHARRKTQRRGRLNARKSVENEADPKAEHWLLS